MPELFDRPQKEKFNYPGVFDRSVKKPETVVVPSDEKPEEEPVKKVRAPRKPKADAEASSGVTGRKSLKLGKIKG